MFMPSLFVDLHASVIVVKLMSEKMSICSVSSVISAFHFISGWCASQCCSFGVQSKWVWFLVTEFPSARPSVALRHISLHYSIKHWWGK